MLRINSHKVRFLGTAEIPEALNEDQEYHVAAFGQVRGASTDTNDDGTRDLTFKFRLNRVEFLKPDGKVVVSKDIKKKSQKLRGAIWNWAQEHGDDDENLYDWFMGWVIGNIDRLIPLAKAEREKEL